MIVFNRQKIHFVTLAIVGLSLQFVFGFAVAIPMQQESPEEFSVETENINYEPLIAPGALKYEKQGRAPEQKRKKDSVFPDAIGDNGSVDIELQDLNSSIYFEDKKKRDRQQFYSSQNERSNSNSNLSEKESSVPSLLKDFANESGFKEKVRNTLKSIKNVTGELTSSDDISTETSIKSNQRETDRAIERNRYQQEQQKVIAQKDTSNKGSNKGSNKEYGSFVIKEFLSKILTFVLYAVLGIVLIKLLFMFIAWQRKLHKY